MSSPKIEEMEDAIVPLTQLEIVDTGVSNMEIEADPNCAITQNMMIQTSSYGTNTDDINKQFSQIKKNAAIKAQELADENSAAIISKSMQDPNGTEAVFEAMLRLASMPSEAVYAAQQNQNKALEAAADSFAKSSDKIATGMLAISAAWKTSMERIIDTRQKSEERELAAHERNMALNKKKKLNEAEMTKINQEEEERHTTKMNAIKAEEEKRKLDEIIRKQDKEVELLSRKTEIENRDLIEEFNKHMELYKQQMKDAREEIGKILNKKNYNLTYEPPKIVIENYRKVVKAGYVSYRIS